MAKAEILWKSDESIRILFPRAKDYLHYKGALTITSKKTKNVSLEIKCIISNYVMENYMDDEITFTGDSISEVYGKMSKYFSKYGMIFIN